MYILILAPSKNFLLCRIKLALKICICSSKNTNQKNIRRAYRKYRSVTILLNKC